MKKHDFRKGYLICSIICAVLNLISCVIGIVRYIENGKGLANAVLFGIATICWTISAIITSKVPKN